jgi:hypothetical protein
MPTVKPTPSADKDYVQLTNEPFEGEGGLYDVLYTVGVTVTNSGKLEAAEVAQVVRPRFPIPSSFRTIIPSTDCSSILLPLFPCST